MKNILLSLTCLSFTHSAFAQTKPTLGSDSVKTLVQKAIFARSPMGRFEAKDFSPGIKSFRGEPRCSADDLSMVFQMQNPPQKIRIPELNEVIKDAKPNDRTREYTVQIDDFESKLRSEMTRQLNLLTDIKDPVAANREICLTSAIFPSPNAVSIGYGFMVFDPQLFYQIIRNEQSNEWSLRAIVAHEFAHQLQFWHLDPTIVKSKDHRLYVRDKELQADCVAAGILTRAHDNALVSELLNERIPFETALSSAFTSLGDFEIFALEQHHGTAYERSLMITIGIQLYKQIGTKNEFSSASLLKACGTYIDDMNKKFGEDLWPITSRIDVK